MVRRKTHQEYATFLIRSSPTFELNSFAGSEHNKLIVNDFAGSEHNKLIVNDFAGSGHNKLIVNDFAGSGHKLNVTGFAD
jgi:hypothetical protein